MKLLPLRFATALVGGLAVLAPAAHAQNFSFTDQNVLFSFRPAAGNGDTDTLILNLGPVSAFYNAAPSSTFAVGDAAAVNATFASLASLSYSVAASNRTITSDSEHPLQTVWATRPRADVDVQSTPWNRQSSGALANTAGKIKSMGDGATTLDGYLTETDTVVIPLSDSGHNVGRWVGSGGSGTGATGNFNSTFQGNAETTTPAVFGAADYVRSDFYQITPGSGQSEYLGYFQFNGDGSATFTAVPEPEEYAAMAGAALIGFAVWRRFRKQA